MPSRFVTVSFLCVLALACTTACGIFRLLTRAVSDWEWEDTAAFGRRRAELAGLDTPLTPSQGPTARKRWAT